MTHVLDSKGTTAEALRRDVSVDAGADAVAGDDRHPRPRPAAVHAGDEAGAQGVEGGARPSGEPMRTGALPALENLTGGFLPCGIHSQRAREITACVRQLRRMIPESRRREAERMEDVVLSCLYG